MAKKLKISSGFSLKGVSLLSRSITDNSFLGNYKSAFKGSGLEFESYRAYNPGSDDSSMIDWKASRRVNDLLVRKLIEERDLEVLFLVDVSSRMLTGSTNKLKAEYAAELVATMSQSVLGGGDSVGLILFGDGVVKEVKPQKGFSQLYAITEELSKVSNYEGYGDIDTALDYVYKRYDSDTLVIVVSDFVDEIENEKILKLSSKKFDLMMMMIRDPRDLSLPSGQGEVLLEDPYSGTTLLVRPDELKGASSQAVSSEIASFKKSLQKYGAQFVFFQTDKPYLKELMSFFKKRENRWR